VWPVAQGLSSPVELVGHDQNGNWVVRSGELLSPNRLRPVSFSPPQVGGQIQVSVGAPVQIDPTNTLEPGPIYSVVVAPHAGQVTLVEPAPLALVPAPAFVAQNVDPAGNPTKDNRLMVLGAFSRTVPAQLAPAPTVGILVGELTGTVPDATGTPGGSIQQGTQPPLSNPVPASVWLFLTGLAALGVAGARRI
jgi:hypothetical protein